MFVVPGDKLGLGITLLVFSLIHMIPGNAVEAMSGERGMDAARYARLLHEFGLDQPLYMQYFEYLKNVLRGDLGFSLSTHEPVFKEFITLFPATIELSICAMLLALVVGIPAGILAALKRNTYLDYSVMGLSLTGFSMPIFWWALLNRWLYTCDTCCINCCSELWDSKKSTFEAVDKHEYDLLKMVSSSRSDAVC